MLTPVLTNEHDNRSVCYKYKPLIDNTLPLKIRITKDRKRTYVNLGISVLCSLWDFTKNQPKPNCPHKDEIEKTIGGGPGLRRARLCQNGAIKGISYMQRSRIIDMNAGRVRTKSKAHNSSVNTETPPAKCGRRFREVGAVSRTVQGTSRQLKSSRATYSKRPKEYPAS